MRRAEVIALATARRDEIVQRFGLTFEAFAANDEKRAAVEREVFILGEASARKPYADHGRPVSAIKFFVVSCLIGYSWFAWSFRAPRFTEHK